MADTEDGRACGPAPGSAPTRLVRRIGRFSRDARGATAIEYAMIGGLIFAVAAAGIRMFGSQTNVVYGRIGAAMTQVN